ncbi:MAG: DNA primase [Bacilli bacterium]|nr:DNA primase [Bacilli bacterium]
MVFDHDLLAEIKSRADIVDVISSYLNVIKKGRRYVALCPFHDDHTPSMDINKERQTFHCYVCHHGGDVFTFVADYEKITFSEAVKRVCEIINFDDPRLHKHEVIKPVDVDVQTLYNCINELQKFYEYGLQIDEGKPALDYLAKRQISREQIEKYSLGYSLQNGKMTISYLQQKGFSLKNIEDIGIALVRSSDTSDSNAGRLIFPIKNSNGQVVGFSARKMTSGDDAPKYVNSPTTKIFKKESILYNYHIAKQSAKHDGYLYLVEGFMDVFALDSIGISSSVAIMGTKLTDKHIELIRRLNVEIRLCLDGDKPGQEAMMKIMSSLDKAGISYRVVSLPGEIRDPDEILKQDGEEKLKVFVKTLVDPFNFALNYYKNISPLETVEDRKKVISHFAPMLIGIKSKLEYEDYIYKLADVTRFNANAIKNFIKEYKADNHDKTDKSILIDEPKYEGINVSRELRRLACAERQVLELMANDKDAIDFYEKNIGYFNIDLHRDLANYFVEYASKYNSVDVSMVMDYISQSDNPNKGKLLYELSAIPLHKFQKHELDEILNDCLITINEERTKNYNRTNIKLALEGKSPAEQARLLDDYIKRTNEKKAK